MDGTRPAKYRDRVPVVKTYERTGSKHWRVGDTWLAATGFFAQAGSDDYPPAGNYRNLEDADPGAWDPVVRLERMDQYGIHAQVLYPNIIGFEAALIMDLGDELSIVCTRAYNDFLTEFASVDPARFIPITMVPFWNIDESLKEIRRAHDQGHKGVLFADKFEKIGLPGFTEPHWDPIYSLCQDLELSINFHVGFAGMREGVHTADSKLEREKTFDARQSARTTSVGIMGNADCVANIIASGLAERFPPGVCCGERDGLPAGSRRFDGLALEGLRGPPRPPHHAKRRSSAGNAMGPFGSRPAPWDCWKSFRTTSCSRRTIHIRRLWLRDRTRLLDDLLTGPPYRVGVCRRYRGGRARKALHDNAARIYHYGRDVGRRSAGSSVRARTTDGLRTLGLHVVRRD